MEEKFTLKAVQNGQTKLARQLRSGAGANGQALVVKATEAASYQLVNQVTLTSPAKLQFKRKGDNLQVSLPGGDPDMPDLVIENYFAVEGSAIKGISQSGEWMAYDTSVFVPKPVSPSDKSGKPFNPENTAPVALGEVPISTLMQFDSPLGLATIGGGALAVGAMGKNGGSGGGSTTPVNNTDALSVIKSYAGASSTAVQPTEAQYTAAGVTVPKFDGGTPTSANVLAALNQVISGKQATDVATTAQVQALADALKTSWAVIIAEANGSTKDQTPDRAPTAADYLNVGVKVGTTTKALDLMNSALAELTSTAVDTTAEIKDLAAAADNLMKLAVGTSGASVSNTDLNALGLKINGVSSAVTTVQADAFSKNLANLSVSLGKAADTTAANTALKSGDAVDTIAEVQALFSLQAMRSYNDDTAAAKTQPAPGVTDYTNIGIQSYASLSDTSDAKRIALDASNFSNVNLQTALNSALDNQASGTALTKTVVQTMVDAYYRVLKEAGSTTTTDTDHVGNYFNLDTNNPKAIDYANLGITQSNKAALADSTSLLKLLNDAVGRANVAAVDTATEIQALEKAAENILAVGKGTGDGKALTDVTYTTDSEWLNGFSSLGVTGVTSSNLSGIKKAIDTADDTLTPITKIGEPIDTVQELQAIVSLYRINDYADDSTNPTPNMQDYKAVVSQAVSGKLTDAIDSDTNYLVAYNDAVRTRINDPSIVRDSFADYAAIKSMVDSYNKILKIADGDKSTAAEVLELKDLFNVGVGNGWSTDQKTVLGADYYTYKGVPNGNLEDKTFEKANNLALLADVIGGKNKADVNTIKELNDLAYIVSRVIQLESKDIAGTSSNTSGRFDLYNSPDGGRLTIVEFKSLGLDVTPLTDSSGSPISSRLYSVYDSIIGNANTDYIKSLKDLQSYINNTLGT